MKNPFSRVFPEMKTSNVTSPTLYSRKDSSKLATHRPRPFIIAFSILPRTSGTLSNAKTPSPQVRLYQVARVLMSSTPSRAGTNDRGDRRKREEKRKREEGLIRAESQRRLSSSRLRLCYLWSCSRNR